MAKRVVNEPILYRGMGAPYVALFDEIGKPVINALTGLPIGAYIDKFSYKTEEGEENLCTLEISTGNPATVDDESLQEGSTLIIQWGYIFPDASSSSGEPVSLKIRDVDILFSDQGTKMTLKCVDKSAKIRQVPIWVPTPEEETSLKDYMDNGLGCNMGIVIERFELEENG